MMQAANGRMRCWRAQAALAIVCCAGGLHSPCSAASSTAAQRQAAVHFSDGTILQGKILITPGRDFRLTTIPAPNQKRGKLRTFGFDVVREMSFVPGNPGQLPPERMEQAYTWDPNDFKKKVYHGQAYPVRQIVSTVTFASGEQVTGVLQTTVAYLKVQAPGEVMASATKKILLADKQQGQPGQTLDALVYVTHIRLLDEGRPAEAKLTVDLRAGKLGRQDELAALTQESLTPVPVTATDQPGRYEVCSTFGENIFLAGRKGSGYLVGWPAEGLRKTELFESVRTCVSRKADYFNERELLGILPNPGGSEVLALVNLRRRVPSNAYSGPGAGEFDKDGKPMEFWRLSVWLWKRDVKTGEMVLSRRGSFFRLRVDAGAPTPRPVISQDLWPVVKTGDRVQVGLAGETGSKDKP